MVLPIANPPGTDEPMDDKNPAQAKQAKQAKQSQDDNNAAALVYPNNPKASAAAVRGMKQANAQGYQSSAFLPVQLAAENRALKVQQRRAQEDFVKARRDAYDNASFLDQLTGDVFDSPEYTAARENYINQTRGMEDKYMANLTQIEAYNHANLLLTPRGQAIHKAQTDHGTGVSASGTNKSAFSQDLSNNIRDDIMFGGRLSSESMNVISDIAQATNQSIGEVRTQLAQQYSPKFIADSLEVGGGSGEATAAHLNTYTGKDEQITYNKETGKFEGQFDTVTLNYPNGEVSMSIERLNKAFQDKLIGQQAARQNTIKNNGVVAQVDSMITRGFISTEPGVLARVQAYKDQLADSDDTNDEDARKALTDLTNNLLLQRMQREMADLTGYASDQNIQQLQSNINALFTNANGIVSRESMEALLVSASWSVHQDKYPDYLMHTLQLDATDENFALVKDVVNQYTGGKLDYTKALGGDRSPAPSATIGRTAHALIMKDPRMVKLLQASGMRAGVDAVTQASGMSAAQFFAQQTQVEQIMTTGQANQIAESRHGFGRGLLGKNQFDNVSNPSPDTLAKADTVAAHVVSLKNFIDSTYNIPADQMQELQQRLAANPAVKALSIYGNRITAKAVLERLRTDAISTVQSYTKLGLISQRVNAMEIEAMTDAD